MPLEDVHFAASFLYPAMKDVVDEVKIIAKIIKGIMNEFGIKGKKDEAPTTSKSIPE